MKLLGISLFTVFVLGSVGFSVANAQTASPSPTPTVTPSASPTATPAATPAGAPNTGFGR